MKRSSPREIKRCMFFAVVFVGLTACVKPALREPAPATAADLMQRGVVLAEYGDDFAAEQYFDAARNAGYPEREVVRQLVQVCVRAGRLEQALMHARSYADRTPEDWLMHHVIATILFVKGEMMPAVHELELVLSEHPEHAESRYLLAIVRRDGIGDIASARMAFEQYLELAPEGAHAAEAKAFIRRTPPARPVVRKRVRS